MYFWFKRYLFVIWAAEIGANQNFYFLDMIDFYGAVIYALPIVVDIWPGWKATKFTEILILNRVD